MICFLNVVHLVTFLVFCFSNYAVKVLNGAHLDASIHRRGELKAGRQWPSPWCIGSGILVAIAFFHYIYKPMQWVALGAVAVGVPPLILKAIAAVRKFVLDINMLMLIAGEILCGCQISLDALELPYNCTVFVIRKCKHAAPHSGFLL